MRVDLICAYVLAGGYPQQGAVGHLMAQEPQRTTKRESKLLGISTATDPIVLCLAPLLGYLG